MQKSADKTEVSILLVEDEELARMSLGRMLALKFPGIGLHVAENGRAGLDLYRRHLPELVITDIYMPLLNGIEMASAIRAHDPEALIIVMSAHNDSRYQLEASKLGVDHYVLKPIDRHSLFAVIDSCLERLSLKRSPLVPSQR